MMRLLYLLGSLALASGYQLGASLTTRTRLSATAAMKVSQSVRLKRVFKRFDSDHNGWLDKEELKAAFEEVRCPLSCTASKSTAHTLALASAFENVCAGHSCAVLGAVVHSLEQLSLHF